MSEHRPSRTVLRLLIAGTVAVWGCSDRDDDADTTDGSDAPTPTTPGSALAGTDAVATPSEPTVAGEARLTFGYLAPGVGLLNTLAIGQQRGLTLAIDEINANGGVLGAPVTAVTAEESADRPIDAVLDELLAQGPDVIVGPVGSAAAASLTPILAERSLLACSASATATSLTATAEAAIPSFARTALRDDHFARNVADELMEADDAASPPATVMLVGRDDVYGNELTAALSAELTARGAAVSTLAYPARRVQFPEEAAAVAAAEPDVVVLAAFAEAPRLVAEIVEGGYPVDRVVGLDGLLVPRFAEQTFPSDPARADGLTVYGTTGDRALMTRLGDVPASEDQVSYGPQMYDCAIALALAAVASGSTEPATIAQQLTSVTSGGRSCSTFAHCVELLAAGEDIDYDGTTGRIAFDTSGDISSARLVTASVVDGRLQPLSSRDVDLVAERQEEIFASAVFVAQLQQALKVLGYYEGDVTGIFDDATGAAVAALQRDLGLPETGDYDAATDAALRERLGGRLDAFGTSVMQLQQALTELGHYTGPIDGRYSDATIAAVKAFQRDLGVPETGIIDVATLRAIYARGEASGAATRPDTPATTVASPAPTTTSPPVTAPAAPRTTSPPVTAPPGPATSAQAAPTTPPPDTDAPPPAEPDLYAVLSDDPQFSTLVDVLRAAGYGSDLSQPGPLTLFAPTNAAFGSLDGDELEQLRSDPTAADTLLRNLAVDEAIPSSGFTTGGLVTIGGSSVEVVVDGDTITFGGAALVQPDINAANGIAHAIDDVPVTG